MNDRRRKTTPDYSDIRLREWKDYPEILTDTWWDFKNRASGNGHKFDYHGNFIPQIATQLFIRYTKENDIIVDWFLGSGTSAIEAANLNRRLVGVELKQDLIEHVRSKVPPEALETGIRLIEGDSTTPQTREQVNEALTEMGASHAQLAVLHPPYADIIKFSEMGSDLSNCDSTLDFIDKFKLVASNAYETLEPERFAALIIGDKYSKGELDPLGFKCMQAMMDVGFKVKSIIVKNIEGNEKAKGKDNNLWRYRALAGGFYVFKHEYVMVFFK